MDLIKELDGFPLALATAAAYLRRTAMSPAKYLSLYKSSWAKLIQKTPSLNLYDRKLYSTWQISLDQIETRNKHAVQLLQFWAYFDNEDLWFELLQHNDPNDPEWLQELTKNELDFEDAIGLLHDYGLLEENVATDQQIKSNGYSIHSCVYSWATHILNQEWDQTLAKLSMECVSSHILSKDSSRWWVAQRRLLRHALKCCNTILKGQIEENGLSWQLYNLGYLFSGQNRFQEAEAMYQRALQGYEKALGSDAVQTYPSALNTMENLGDLCKDFENVNKARLYYERAQWGISLVFGTSSKRYLDLSNKTHYLLLSDRSEV
jgi:tetratricopeptide (TPR) repeat protein